MGLIAGLIFRQSEVNVAHHEPLIPLRASRKEYLRVKQIHQQHELIEHKAFQAGDHHVLQHSGNTEILLPFGGELGSTRGRGCQGRCMFMPTVYMMVENCQESKKVK